MTQIESSVGAQPRMPINWCTPGSTKCFTFIRDFIATPPLPECAKQTPPCPIMPPPPFVFKAGDRIEGLVNAGILTADNGMQIPVAVLQPAAPTPYSPQVVLVQKPDGGMTTMPVNPSGENRPTGTGAKGDIEAKDPWTGGVEWDEIFSARNFWRAVIVIFFVYLFLKHVLPLLKTSFKKA